MDEYQDLDPELQQYLEPMRTFGQMLRHPLVFAVPYFGAAENERLNQMFKHKKEKLKGAIERKDHVSYVFVHERPYRLQALMEIHGEVPKKKLLPLMLEVYTDSENIGQNYDQWEELLDGLTGTDPWNTVKELPEGEFNIYRGAGDANGFSWTLDPEKAEWFAQRYGQNMPVYQATVTREDVIGYYDGRGEKEVIVHPADIAGLITGYYGDDEKFIQQREDR